jgi:DNA-binding GntR family transcriptional regulator
MTKESELGYRSLKNLVYDYIREQMKTGALAPGATINIEETSKKLGISKTPLREALIKLEAEGFVKIAPWRGVMVQSLSLEDFKECYQVIGALEAAALVASTALMDKQQIRSMEDLNARMRQAIAANDFEAYYERNIAFHGVYLGLSHNKTLADIVDVLKKKLYEFSRPMEFIKEWEDVSLAEHDTLVGLLKQGEFRKAADFLRDTIWSFEVQKKYITKYYHFTNHEGE